LARSISEAILNDGIVLPIRVVQELTDLKEIEWKGEGAASFPVLTEGSVQIAIISLPSAKFGVMQITHQDIGNKVRLTKFSLPSRLRYIIIK
jgi:hypothetical protein